MNLHELPNHPAYFAEPDDEDEEEDATPSCEECAGVDFVRTWEGTYTETETFNTTNHQQDWWGAENHDLTDHERWQCRDCGEDASQEVIEFIGNWV
jgi:hypothetical protein